MGDEGDDIGWLLARLEEHHQRTVTNGNGHGNGAAAPPRPVVRPLTRAPAAAAARPKQAVRSAGAGPVFVRHLRRPVLRTVVEHVRALLH